MRCPLFVGVMMLALTIPIIGSAATRTDAPDYREWADGTTVILYGMPVVASFEGDWGNLCFYIEEPNRAWGIRVNYVPGQAFPSVNDLVDVVGTLQTSEDGYRYMEPSSVCVNIDEFQEAGSFIPPIGMRNPWTGGAAHAYQPGVIDDATAVPPQASSGLNSVGLMVQTWGWVRARYDDGTYADSYFYIDDGYRFDDPVRGSFDTGLKDGSGNLGIRCRRRWRGEPLPALGTFVAVEGILSTRKIGENIVRELWPVRIIKDPDSGLETKILTSPAGTVLPNWNLMGFPLPTDDSSPVSMFSPIPETDLDGNLTRWDSPTQSLVTYDWWMPQSFGSVFSGEGYWLNNVDTAEKTLSYTGLVGRDAYDNKIDQYLSFPIEGWAYLSHPQETDIPWADAQATDARDVVSLTEAARTYGWINSLGYWWQNSTQSLMILGLEDDWPDDTYLRSWRGYNLQGLTDQMGLLIRPDEPVGGTFTLSGYVRWIDCEGGAHYLEDAVVYTHSGRAVTDATGYYEIPDIKKLGRVYRGAGVPTPGYYYPVVVGFRRSDRDLATERAIIYVPELEATFQKDLDLYSQYGIEVTALPDSITACGEQDSTITVNLRDGSGAGRPGTTTINLDIVGGTGQFISPQQGASITVDLTDGTGTAVLRSGTSGDAGCVRARWLYAPNECYSENECEVHYIPYAVTVSAQSFIKVGNTVPVTATVSDGDPKPGVTVSFSVSPADAGTFNPTMVQTNIDGVASTDFTAGAQPGSITIYATGTMPCGGQDAQGKTICDIGTSESGRAFIHNVYLHPGGPVVRTTAYDEAHDQVRELCHAYGPEGEVNARTGSTDPVSYTYDALYRTKTLADGKGQTSTYSYDEAGNLVRIEYPGGDVIQFPDHDPNGNALKRIDGNGQVTEYIYEDPESLLTDIQYPAAPSIDVHFTYHPLYGTLVELSDGTGVTQYAYDDLDVATAVTTVYTGLPAAAVAYEYWPDASLKTTSTPAGSFSYTYDGAGRPVGLANPFNETFSWTYYDNNWLSTQTLSNSAGAPVAVTSYSYNPRGFLASLTNRTGGGAVLSQYSGSPKMTYDALGNLMSMAVNIPAVPTYGGVSDYTYDARDRLIQEQSTRNGGYTYNFVYDAAGNPTLFEGQSRSFNSKNQNTAYTYDANGNPVSYKGTTVSYDPEDRMTAYGSAVTAGYAGDGLRVWKDAGAGRTYFLYANGMPVCEMDAAGNVIATNTFGANGLASRNTAAGSVFYTFDPQGNVAQAQDAAGNVTATVLYDAYGTRLSVDATIPYGYGGQFGYYTDPETDLQLLMHRYYDAEEGRFLTRDPIEYAGGMNLYAYVGDNPIVYVDPFGLFRRGYAPSTWEEFWNICFEDMQAGDWRFKALDIVGFNIVTAADVLSTPEEPLQHKIWAVARVVEGVGGSQALKLLSKAKYAQKFTSVATRQKSIGYWLKGDRIRQSARWRAGPERLLQARDTLSKLRLASDLYLLSQDQPEVAPGNPPGVH